MSTEEEEQHEMVFSSVLLNQKEKVEKECIKIQTLIDIESSNASFMWLPDSNHVNIIDDIFRKSKRIREDEDDDNDDEDDDIPANSIVPHNSNIHHNSAVHQMKIKKIGGKKHITPEIVVPKNGVVLEVEGNQSPPSFIPYSMVNSGEQIPEHVPWSQQREHLLVPLN
jgi:hypothetical protein